MKRFLAVFLMLALLLTGLTVTASAANTGWVKEGDVWYYYKADGTKLTNDWVQTNGKWYYLWDDGAMYADGILEIKEKWYGFDKTGAMVANNWFSTNWEGVREDGTAITGKDWYYAGADGAFIRGWKQIGGKWYYFEKETAWTYTDEETGETFSGRMPPYMATGIRKIDTKWYAFKQSGEMIVGWGQPFIGDPRYVTPNTAWVYANADGSLAEKWKKIDGKWYYFFEGWPVMASGTTVWFKQANGKYDIYGFNKSGAMVENGWLEEKYENGSDWYYLGADGLAKKGWFQDKGKWYYLDPDYAIMWHGGFVPMSDGKTYYLDTTTGAMKTGWLQDGDNWFYFKDSGAMAVKEWVKSGSAWYYLKEDGKMAKDEILTIDGKPYKFDANGVWVP